MPWPFTRGAGEITMPWSFIMTWPGGRPGGITTGSVIGSGGITMGWSVISGPDGVPRAITVPGLGLGPYLETSQCLDLMLDPLLLIPFKLILITWTFFKWHNTIPLQQTNPYWLANNKGWRPVEDSRYWRCALSCFFTLSDRHPWPILLLHVQILKNTKNFLTYHKWLFKV